MKSTFLRIPLLALAIFAVGIRATEPTQAELQNQLRFARSELLELKKKYTDDHPKVAEQRAKIAALEKQAGPATAEPLNPAERAPRQFSIDFPGGTVRDFLTAISKIEGVSISIVSAGDQADLKAPIPPFSLHNTTAMTTVQVLQRVLMPRGLDLSPVSGDPNSVVAILSGPQKPIPMRLAPSRFESFQLAPYLADQSIDDIVGAIRAAWELDPQHDPNALHLKFHPQTSILLMSGPVEGLELAMKIISQLKRSAKAEPKPAQKTASPPEAEKR